MKNLSEQEVDDERRRGGQQRAGHQHVVGRAARRRRVHIVQHHRHRLRRGLAEGDADQKVVPDAGDLQDQNDDQDVARHRQHDLEEDLPETAGIDHRGGDQLLRDAAKIIGEDQRQDRHRERRMHERDAPGRAEDVQRRR